MRCVSCSVTPYSIPVRLALHIGIQSLATREGFIIRLSGTGGACGTGEVAPLPGLHIESYRDAEDQVTAVAAAINNRALPAEESLIAGFLSSLNQPLYPSVRAGFEMALYDLLWSHASTDNPVLPVPLNALITEDAPDPAEMATHLVESGYTSLKLKVGRNNPEKDILLVNSVRSAVQGRAGLRLDANRAWSVEESIRFGRSIGPDGIEYVEEPVRDGIGIADFYLNTRIPVALDETLTDPEFMDSSIPKGVSAFVLKPAILGSISRTIHLIQMAQSHGIHPVLSSCFESAAGLKFYAQMALNNGLTGHAHGLDTWRWLYAEPESPLKITRGCINPINS